MQACREIFGYVVVMANENASIICSKLRTVCCLRLCVGQCIEGSLNHPSLTMQHSVAQHCLSLLSLQPLNKRWGWGETEPLSCGECKTCHLVVTGRCNAREAKGIHRDFIAKLLLSVEQ